MTEQLAIDGPAAPILADGRTLTARQARAYTLVRSTPGGVTADELGAHFHRHGVDERCDWCTATGHQLLRSKALGPLVVRRRGGMWQPRDGSGAPLVPDKYLAGTSQVHELPGSTFEDIFGDAA